MNKNIVKYTFVLAMGFACTTWSLAQEEQVPAPKNPTSKADQDLDAKATKALEKRRAAQAANAAKAKALQKRRAAQAKAKADAEAKAIDINRASKAELKKLPGITDAYADAIIAKRPYKTKAELVTKNVLPMGVYQTIHEQVAAKYVPIE